MAVLPQGSVNDESPERDDSLRVSTDRAMDFRWTFQTGTTWRKPDARRSRTNLSCLQAQRWWQGRSKTTGW